jgi:hypothetical protein
MIPYFNVLGLRVETWILGKIDIALPITNMNVIHLLHAPTKSFHPQHFFASLKGSNVLCIWG